MKTKLLQCRLTLLFLALLVMLVSSTCREVLAQGERKPDLVVLLKDGQRGSVRLALDDSDHSFRALIRLDGQKSVSQHPFLCKVGSSPELRIEDQTGGKVYGETESFSSSGDFRLSAKQASLKPLSVEFDCSRMGEPETLARVEILASFIVKADDVFQIKPRAIELRLGSANKETIRLTNELAEPISIHIPSGGSKIQLTPSGSITLEGGASQDVTLLTERLDSQEVPELTFTVGDAMQNLAIHWISPWPWGWIFAPFVVLFVSAAIAWRFLPRKILRDENENMIAAIEIRGTSTLAKKFQWPRGYMEPNIECRSKDLDLTVRQTSRHHKFDIYQLRIDPKTDEGREMITVWGGAGWKWGRPIKATFSVDWQSAVQHSALQQPAFNSPYRPGYQPVGSSPSEPKFADDGRGAVQQQLARDIKGIADTVQSTEATVKHFREEVKTLDLRNFIEAGLLRLTEEVNLVGSLSEEIGAVKKTLAESIQRQKSDANALSFAFDRGLAESRESARKTFEQIDLLVKHMQPKERPQQDPWMVRLLEDAIRERLLDAINGKLSKRLSDSVGARFLKLADQVQKVSDSLSPIASKLASAQSSEARSKLKELTDKVSRVKALLLDQPLELTLSIKCGADAEKSIATQIAKQLENLLRLLDDPVTEIQSALDWVIEKEVPAIVKTCDQQKKDDEFRPLLQGLFAACGLEDTTPSPGAPFSPDDHYRSASQEGSLNTVVGIVDRGFKYKNRVIQPPKVVVGIGGVGQSASKS